ncbi:hypothetical protein ACKWTF_007168 [Chironomus riparius]
MFILWYNGCLNVVLQKPGVCNCCATYFMKKKTELSSLTNRHNMSATVAPTKAPLRTNSIIIITKISIDTHFSIFPSKSQANEALLLQKNVYIINIIIHYLNN